MDNKSSKIIAIVALVVAVVGLSVGFAAFSSVLTIESTAEVNPNSDTFSVGFSTSSSELAEGNVTATTTTGATASAATITNSKNAATISGLKASFTEPGQSATYSFYVYNDSPYTAYLNTIQLADGETFKECSIPSNSLATQGLVTAACNDITLKVKVGNAEEFTGTTLSPNEALASETAVPVTVVISYANNNHRADGAFNVDFGNIELYYSTTSTAN